MKLDYIDSIRGIAILMVILVHTGQSVSNLDPFFRSITEYGQMGVQLFFVASAFTLSLSSKNRQNEPNKFKNYAIRRFFRIAPAYYIGLILYLCINWIESIYFEGSLKYPYEYNLKNILSNITFTHGFYAPGNNNIVPGGWSIGTEMAFYVVFPFIYWFSNNNTSMKKIITTFFVIIVLTQLALYLLHSNTIYTMRNNSFTYYNLLTQLPVFYIGIAYFFLRGDAKKYCNGLVSLTILLVLTSFTIYYSYVFKDNYAFSIVPIISGISFVFVFELFRNYSFLNNKVLVRIGQYSYSMYLLHFIFAHKIGALVENYLSAYLHPLLILIILYTVGVAFTFQLTRLSYRFIEKPSMNLGKSLLKR